MCERVWWSCVSSAVWQWCPLRTVTWWCFSRALGAMEIIYCIHVGVSKNNGTRKSSNLNRVFHYKVYPFWGTPILGNTYVIWVLHLLIWEIWITTWNPILRPPPTRRKTLQGQWDRGCYRRVTQDQGNSKVFGVFAKLNQSISKGSKCLRAHSELNITLQIWMDCLSPHHRLCRPGLKIIFVVQIDENNETGVHNFKLC